MTTPTPPDVSYTCAYWDYVRCKPGAKRPVPSEFGLSEDMADVIRRQCLIENEARIKHCNEKN